MSQTITIDATGQKLGRLATDIAMILQGKRTPAYQPHVLESVQIIVTNASKIEMAERMDREYLSYSGYPGGLRREKASKLKERKGMEAIVRNTVSGMLPKNTHRSRLLLRITVQD
jgi:large subunit ribosomal protein L13